MKNSENKKKVILGLDLGTNWHGWSLLEVNDEDNSKSKIIQRGSHWFGSLSDPQTHTYKMGERGEFRRTRRTISRKKQRRIDFIKLIEKKYKDIFNFYINEIIASPKFNIYELSVKGLSESLLPDELFRVLISKLSNRGSQHELKNNSGISIFEKLLELYNNGKVRGVGAKTFQVIQDKIDSNNNETLEKEIKTEVFQYSRNDLKKEIEKVIDNCKYLPNDFKVNYFNIFDRHRDFAFGPGQEQYALSAINKLSNAEWNEAFKWSGFKKAIDDETGEIILKRCNLWESSIKKCPVYGEDGEKVAFKGCPSTEISALVTQLSFLRINSSKLTAEQRKLIWNNILEKQVLPTLSNFAKILGVNKSDFKNYPTIEKSGKDKFEELKIFRHILKNNIINFKDLNDLFKSDKLLKFEKILEKIIEKYFIFNGDENANYTEIKFNSNYSESLKELELLSQTYDIEINENFLNLTIYKEVASSRANFSSKALIEYISENFDIGKYTLSSKYSDQIKKSNNSEYVLYSENDHSLSREYINEHLFDNKTFLSPDIKNASIECIRIINKKLKWCKENSYYLSNIIIETTRDDKNSFLTKKQKQEMSSKNKKINDLSIDLAKLTISKSAQLKLKTLIMSQNKDFSKTWKTKDYVDLYTGEPITIEEVLSNPMLFEIEHVLPISRSGNNNQSNKILVRSSSNQIKKNLTSYELYGKNEKILSLWVDCVKSENYELYKNLMMEVIPKGFLTSQLNNVSNIMRQVVNGLNLWSKDQNERGKYFDNILITTVSGATTQKIREITDLDTKDRSDNEHHSIDASICALLGSLKEFVKVIYPKFNKEDGKFEYISNFNLFDGTYNNEIKKIADTISQVDWELSVKKKTKFFENDSVDKKLDYFVKKRVGEAMKSTIYSWIEIDGIKYTKNKYKLYVGDIKNCKTLFSLLQLSYTESKCLNTMEQFNKMKEIYEKYYNPLNNPFITYLDESISIYPEWSKYKNIEAIPYFDQYGVLKTIKTLSFIGKKASIGKILHNKNNSFKSGMKSKAIILVEDTKGFKKFINLDSTNSALEGIEKFKILDIIENNEFYIIPGEKEIYRVAGCHKTNGTIQLSFVNNHKKTNLQKPYSSFEEIGFMRYKYY
ncbi:MAG: type II CRISPR RNA-guided endonuclease Cas9 [Mycoplasma sp.]